MTLKIWYHSVYFSIRPRAELLQGGADWVCPPFVLVGARAGDWSPSSLARSFGTVLSAGLDTALIFPKPSQSIGVGAHQGRVA
jgi:hypothetical protein